MAEVLLGIVFISCLCVVFWWVGKSRLRNGRGTSPVVLPIVRAGDVCMGPDGMGYRITRDVYPYEIVEASQFEALTPNTPIPTSYEEMPIWLAYWIRGMKAKGEKVDE